MLDLQGLPNGPWPTPTARPVPLGLRRSSGDTTPIVLCIVVDISQNVGYRRPARHMVPTLMKSTNLVVLFKDAAQDFLFTPSELAAIHGLDISPAVLRRLTVSQVRGLVGNSMHVAQIGAFVQFAFAARTWSNDQ